jgi:hypothetical protein
MGQSSGWERQRVDGKAGSHGDPFDETVAVDLLADLQAGLLDDRTAAGIRRRARTDPEVARRLAALDRARRDVANLGVDAASAPDVPAGVAARVGAELRSLPAPANEVVDRRAAATAHAARAPAFGVRTAAAGAGVAAVLAAAAIGATMLIRGGPDHRFDTGPSASSITVARPPGGVPLPDREIFELLGRAPELGTLSDPQRRMSCLSGLGYPTSTSILGARPLAVNGRPGLLLLLPGDDPNRIDTVVVAPNCSTVDTGLLASSSVERP